MVTQPRATAEIVGDVVAVVAVGRGVEGISHRQVTPRLGEVVDALGEADDVAAAVAVASRGRSRRRGSRRRRSSTTGRWSARCAVSISSSATGADDERPSAARPPPRQRAPCGVQPQLRAARRAPCRRTCPCAPGSPGGGANRLSARSAGRSASSPLLGLHVRARQVAVHQAGGELLAEDRVDGRQPDPQLAPRVLGGAGDRARGDLGLVDRRHGLRVPVQARADPVELRRVEARQLDEADPDARACRAAARRAASRGSP